MHPAVHATTRTPGPSTVAPVVNECRKPMSPLASALRTSDSGTWRPRSTLRSYGLRASSGVFAAASPSDMRAGSVEGPVDDVHLLLAREPHEVHRVAGHPDRQARVLVGMLDRVEQRLAVEHV